MLSIEQLHKKIAKGKRITIKDLGITPAMLGIDPKYTRRKPKTIKVQGQRIDLKKLEEAAIEMGVSLDRFQFVSDQLRGYPSGKVPRSKQQASDRATL